MLIHVPTISSKSCFSLTNTLIEEQQRCLLPKTMEILIDMKDWELEERRE